MEDLDDLKDKHLDAFSIRQLKRLNALLDVKKTRLHFATKHHRNTDENPMVFDDCHFIKGLYNSLAAEIVVLGGTQTFKSEWLLIDHLAMAYNGFSVFFVVRNHDAKNAYVQGRINHAIDAVPFYRKLMKNAIFDRMDIKKFGKGRIKYVGSGVEAEFREFPASSIFVDEVNDCNWDNVRYGMSRMDASHYKFKRFVGNSKTKDHPLEQLFEESTQQKWCVPCVACGKKNGLDWFDVAVKPIEDSSGNIVDYVLLDTEWKIGCGRDIHLICPHCGGALERLSPKGEWVAQNNDFNREGFHIPSLCSSVAQVGELWKEFQTSINSPRDMQIFFSRRLAVPFSAAGSKVTAGILDRCGSNYEMIIRPDRGFIKGDSHEGPCTMGVDVGSQTCDIRISTPASSHKRKAVFIAKIPTININELHDLVARYNVKVAVVDIQPEQALATEFQETAACDVWLCKMGRGGDQKTMHFNYAKRIVSPDKTELLDRTFAQLMSGSNLLPGNFKDLLMGAYVEEMCLPVREMTNDIHGNPKYVWTKGRDHQRLADAYDYVAGKIMDDGSCTIDMGCVYNFNEKAVR